MAADPALEGEPHRLGRGHFRAAFLLKRRPGIGVQDLARLTGLSKQGASRVLKDLIEAGYAEIVVNDEGRPPPPHPPDRRRRRLRGPRGRADARGTCRWPSGTEGWTRCWARGASWPPSPDRGPPDEVGGADMSTARHLLVVDDDDRIRDLLREFLDAGGLSRHRRARRRPRPQADGRHDLRPGGVRCDDAGRGRPVPHPLGARPRTRRRC